MEGKDNIKDLFSQKLGNYEAPVNPELWAKISSQVATAGATTTAATGLSVFAKVAIGLGISAAAITTIVILSSSREEVVSEYPIKEVQKETTTSTKSTKEQVAELDESSVIESIDNDNSGAASTSSSDGTGETSMPKMYRSPDIEVITDSDLVLPKMEIRNAGALNEGVGSGPEIVEGIAYSEVTQYGSTTEEVEEIITEEPVTPKVEPIKRFVNVFTPNGKNPEFFLESEGLTDFNVVVFNPNGDIVFQSNDPEFRWDGRDKRTGEMVDSGNYMYMVSAYDSEGNPYPIYERLTIIVN